MALIEPADQPGGTPPGRGVLLPEDVAAADADGGAGVGSAVVAEYSLGTPAARAAIFEKRTCAALPGGNCSSVAQAGYRYGHVAVAGGTIAQPAPSTITPAYDAPGGAQRTPLCEGYRIAETGHGYRRQGIGITTVAELPVIIFPPASHGLVGLQHARALAECHDMRGTAQSAHTDRCVTFRGGAGSQPTSAVVSPAFDSAPGNQCTAMHLGSSDTDSVAQPRYGDRRQAIDGRAIAKLTPVIPAPARHRTVALECAGMVLSDADGYRRTQAADLDGLIAIACCAIAKLAVGVITPAPDGAVAAQGTEE